MFHRNAALSLQTLQTAQTLVKIVGHIFLSVCKMFCCIRLVDRPPSLDLCRCSPAGVRPDLGDRGGHDGHGGGHHLPAEPLSPLGTLPPVQTGPGAQETPAAHQRKSISHLKLCSCTRSQRTRPIKCVKTDVDVGDTTDDGTGSSETTPTQIITVVSSQLPAIKR